MAARLQLGCLADWQPEQSLALLPLHHVTGHRLQCMSAAIGLTAVHIGTDTVGFIRASACASKRPKLILRPFHPLRPLGDIRRYRFPHRRSGALRLIGTCAISRTITTPLPLQRSQTRSYPVSGSRLCRPCPLQSGHGVVLLALFIAIRRTPFIAALAAIFSPHRRRLYARGASSSTSARSDSNRCKPRESCWRRGRCMRCRDIPRQSMVGSGARACSPYCPSGDG